MALFGQCIAVNGTLKPIKVKRITVVCPFHSGKGVRRGRRCAAGENLSYAQPAFELRRGMWANVVETGDYLRFRAIKTVVSKLALFR